MSSPEPQQIGELTVTSRQTSTGLWWEWRDQTGRLVHAGMANRQMVLGRYYERRDGRWSEAAP